MLSNVFIPYTAYNVLLGFAIAAQYQDDENLFIVTGPMQDACITTLRILREITPAVRIKMVVVPHKEGRNNLSRFFVKKHVVKTLETLFPQLENVGRVYYFEEWYIVTHYCLQAIEKKNHDVQLYQVEDGIETYVKLRHKVKNILERGADKIFYGKWHADIEIPGTLRKKASICALFPEMLPSVFNSKEKITIKPDILKRQIEICRCDFIVKHKLPVLLGSTNVLITVDDEKYVDSPEYKAIVMSNIREAQASRSSVLIKIHPADQREHDFRVGLSELIMLPPRLPVEIYYLLYAGQFGVVIGGLSTCLLTARWLLPEARINSIFPQEFLGSITYSSDILNFYKRCGVSVTVLQPQRDK